ncbi:MAG: transporter substrate-binding domain-containing protein [Pseudomonadota bacterium]
MKRPTTASSALAATLAAALAGPAAVSAAAPATAPAAAAPLTVAWRDKAPYHYVENGVDQGFLLARAKAVFAGAGLETQFVMEPAKRIWANLGNGTPNYCSIGWYRLPERERVARFSKPFHTDQPHTILAAPDAAARVRAHPSLRALLADAGLTLGVVDGVSYGAQLDALIAASANRIDRRTVTPTRMMQMLAAGRISFMFIDRADLAHLTGREASLGSAARHDFADMPAGLTRHLVCSRDVAPALMARIDKAIDKLRAEAERTPGAPGRNPK